MPEEPIRIDVLDFCSKHCGLRNTCPIFTAHENFGLAYNRLMDDLIPEEGAPDDLADETVVENLPNARFFDPAVLQPLVPVLETLGGAMDACAGARMATPETQAVLRQKLIQDREDEEARRTARMLRRAFEHDPELKRVLELAKAQGEGTLAVPVKVAQNGGHKATSSEPLVVEVVNGAGKTLVAPDPEREERMEKNADLAREVQDEVRIHMGGGLKLEEALHRVYAAWSKEGTKPRGVSYQLLGDIYFDGDKNAAYAAVQKAKKNATSGEKASEK